MSSITNLSEPRGDMTDETRPKYVQLLLPNIEGRHIQIRVSAKEEFQNSRGATQRQQRENNKTIEIVISQISLDGEQYPYRIQVDDDTNLLRPPGEWEGEQDASLPLSQENQDRLWKILLLVVLGIHSLVEAALSLTSNHTAIFPE